jgi:hypothetical protein
VSVYQNRPLCCPACGFEQVQSVLVSLNGQRTPRIVEEIRRGVFQHLRCERCGAAFVADGPLIYTDFSLRRWVGVFPRTWEEAWRSIEHQSADSHRRAMIDHAPAIVREMADGFAIRTVFGLPALAEKILCWDHGLDDRLVEVLKLDLYRSEGGPAADPLRRPRLIAASGDRLDFACDGLLPDGDTLSVGTERLDAIAGDVAAWQGALDRIASGPYVDVGRLLIDGDADPPWSDVRAPASFGQLSWQP